MSACSRFCLQGHSCSSSTSQRLHQCQPFVRCGEFAPTAWTRSDSWPMLAPCGTATTRDAPHQIHSRGSTRRRGSSCGICAAGSSSALSCRRERISERFCWQLEGRESPRVGGLARLGRGARTFSPRGTASGSWWVLSACSRGTQRPLRRAPALSDYCMGAAYNLTRPSPSACP